jgi:hypothetical protein
VTFFSYSPSIILYPYLSFHLCTLLSCPISLHHTNSFDNSVESVVILHHDMAPIIGKKKLGRFPITRFFYICLSRPFRARTARRTSVRCELCACPRAANLRTREGRYSPTLVLSATQHKFERDITSSENSNRTKLPMSCRIQALLYTSLSLRYSPMDMSQGVSPYQ